MPGYRRSLLSGGGSALWLLVVFSSLTPSGSAFPQPVPEAVSPNVTEDARKDESQDGPSITATPNPVIDGSGQGTTVVRWECTAPGAKVYLSVNGGPEQHFSDGPVGLRDAPWISEGPTYDFRLYAGEDRKTLLAAVKVTCRKTAVTSPPIASKPNDAVPGQPQSERKEPADDEAVFIRASPNPLPAGENPTTTTIRWQSAAPNAQVYLSVDSGPEQLFSGGPHGSQEVGWISAGTVNEFRLYEDSTRSRLLASVPVTRGSTPITQTDTPPPTRNGLGILSFSAIAVTVAFLALLALRSKQNQATRQDTSTTS
jgi:hypothetical protein